MEVVKFIAVDRREETKFTVFSFCSLRIESGGGVGRNKVYSFAVELRVLGPGRVVGQKQSNAVLKWRPAPGGRLRGLTPAGTVKRMARETHERCKRNGKPAAEI